MFEFTGQLDMSVYAIGAPHHECKNTPTSLRSVRGTA